MKRSRLPLGLTIMASIILSLLGCMHQPSVDWTPRLVKSTDHAETRAYDEQWLNALQEKWNAAVYKSVKKFKATGDLTLEFIMHEDGQVSDIKVVRSSKDPLLDEIGIRAIQEVRPIPWPKAYRAAVGSNRRKIAINVTGYRNQPVDEYKPKPVQLTGHPAETRAYDEKWLNAVQEKWYAAVDKRVQNFERAKTLKMEFFMHEDGHVSDIKIVSSTNDPLLDEIGISAIRDVRPMPWPKAHRAAVGSNRRKITITLTYHAWEK